MLSYTHLFISFIIHSKQPIYCIAGNFYWCTFSYELPIYIHVFRILNIRTAQDSDVEHIVQGHFRSFNFRMMLYNTKNTKISTIRKLPAIRYMSDSPTCIASMATPAESLL